MNDEQYVDFFFGAPQGVDEIVTLELSHPAFSRVWRFQRSIWPGFTAALETGESVEWAFLPMALRQSEDRGNLDFGLTVTFGDVGEILPDEIQSAREAGTLRTIPVSAVYRIYRSDDTSGPVYGPVRLQVPTVTRNREGAQFDARAPQLNVYKTGALYRTDLIPTLLGFL